MSVSQVVLAGKAEGPVLLCEAGLSFWGGVDPATSTIQDAHHPQAGHTLNGRVVMMPTSRGSCTGGAILLGLALSAQAPAALVFRKSESILTLGAVIAEQLFGLSIPVLRLSDKDYKALSTEHHAVVDDHRIVAGSLSIALAAQSKSELRLSDLDKSMLGGDYGEATRVAMNVIVAMANVQSAESLIDISQVHIDGCIYTDPALLTFAERVAAMKAKVRVPTTLNAISVDYANWRGQGVSEAFGRSASQLADHYVSMGAKPSFTCAPYLLPNKPKRGEAIAWAESNAVVYANTVLGARTEKHPDMLDLCIAITGRAPKSGVYHSDKRVPDCVVTVSKPQDADDSFWPMLGWLLGDAAPECIPLVKGLEDSKAGEDDLKALCAAFGTTSAAPMLHVAGVTPEADDAPRPYARQVSLGVEDFIRVWQKFNVGDEAVDLVALGSPHFSATESRAFLAALAGRKVGDQVAAIVTLGRATRSELSADGTAQALLDAGVQLVSDVCWCSITEPVFPPLANVVLTNSGKYAHYGPGLSGREVRLGSLADCANSAVSGIAPRQLPTWLNLNKWR